MKRILKGIMVCFGVLAGLAALAVAGFTAFVVVPDVLEGDGRQEPVNPHAGEPLR